MRVLSAAHEVSVIARGEHLRAIQARGLKLLVDGREKVARIGASDDAATFGPQDFVLCTLKAHQANESARSFAPLLGTATAVLTAMNGVPWWYFYKAGGRFEGYCVRSVEFDGRQWDLIGPQRVIGCVVEPAALLGLCRAMLLETKAVNEALGIGIPAAMVDRRYTAFLKLRARELQAFSGLSDHP